MTSGLGVLLEFFVIFFHLFSNCIIVGFYLIKLYIFMVYNMIL